MLPLSLLDFQKDSAVFLENWKLAYGTVLLQERIAYEKMLKEKMYLERMQSLTGMVAGIAHEVNTPLGVIRTSVSLVGSLVKRLTGESLSDEARTEIGLDLKESCRLLDRNIDRADHLIQSFKKLSSDQLHDELATTDLESVISDCIELMSPKTRKCGISFRVHKESAGGYKWVGFPGHLSQVVLNLIQNTIRYGYPEGGGYVDITLRVRPQDECYEISYADHGRGIQPGLLARIFEPFVTTGRSQGGTGLGLAIAHNIITHLLQGKIDCVSTPGAGATFRLVLPKIVRVAQTDSAAPNEASIRKAGASLGDAL